MFLPEKGKFLIADPFLLDNYFSRSVVSNCIKFFLGYSGWEGKQLQNEMKESTWIVGDSSKHLMFVEKEENIWRQSLISMGGDFAQMSNYPIHPSLN